MPYFNDIDIINRVQEHLDAALTEYPDMDWFVIVAQGSMNYGMMDEESDVDTKLLSVPDLREIVLNTKPRNKVFEMPNGEHVDIKDVREYFKIFRKSNINFVEILFSDYWVVNEKYEDLWFDLRNRAEDLAHINPYAAVSCMGGMSKEKYHSLTHEYPSRMPWIKKYGYDPKQLSHLLRIYYFIKLYTTNTPYKDCIYLKDNDTREMLLKYKRNGNGLNKEQALALGEEISKEIDNIVAKFRNIYKNEIDKELDSFLNNILYRLICRALKKEIMISS